MSIQPFVSPPKEWKNRTLVDHERFDV